MSLPHASTHCRISHDFALSSGSIPWFLEAEMFPQETRDAALSATVTVNWFRNICLGLGFIQLIVSEIVLSTLSGIILIRNARPVLILFTR